MIGRKGQLMLPGRVRNKLDASINTLRAKFDIGDYWYWLDTKDVEEEIDIHSLVFPLRYDILIRKGFFEYYAEHRDMYRDDPSTFLRFVKQNPYYDWFCRVLVERYAPQLRDNPEALTKDFASRVTASVKLYDSIVSHGFDKSSPIIPYTGRCILPADSGRETDARYFMGDGCHRLACLMSLGHKTLPRDFVRVKCFKRLVPLDNSRLLADSIKVEPEWL